MKNKGMNLAWIVGKDFDKTIKFYTEVLGLTLLSRMDEYQWAELQGKDGAMIGVSVESEMCPLKAGQNAILTYTVDNIEEVRKEFLEKGVNLIGDIVEVPGHVKLQLFTDSDGNMSQLAQLLTV